MQVLNAAPREALTATQVKDLLTGHSLNVDFGVEVLGLDLVLSTGYGTNGDISADVVGGSVERHMNNRVHGTCRLDLSTELPWGSVLIRPYMMLSDADVEARFNCGVYMLTTPEKPIGETPATFRAHGLDRVYLLDREVGADYSVTAGTTYYTALVNVFAAAELTGFQIDSAAADFTLPVTRTWPLVGSSTDPDQTSTPVTYLRIVNDLLTAINFRGVWADENGQFRCQQYQSPADRGSEFEFNADDDAVSIVGEDRTLIADQWKSPNRWVFINTNDATPVEGSGVYTYNLPDSDSMSAVNRRLTWTKVYEYDAASQAALVGLGDRRVAHDRRLSTQFKVTTGPFPAAGHADVFTYIDAAAGGSRKVQAVEWSFDLDGGDVGWTWEAV